MVIPAVAVQMSELEIRAVPEQPGLPVVPVKRAVFAGQQTVLLLQTLASVFVGNRLCSLYCQSDIAKIGLFYKNFSGDFDNLIIVTLGKFQ